MGLECTLGVGGHGAGRPRARAGGGPTAGRPRLEIYLTNPAQEPDMSKWVTQLAFRLADQ
jgi:hypothetical protein